MGLGDTLDQRRERRAVADVAGVGLDRTARGAGFVREFVEGGLRASDADDVTPVAGEAEGDGLADTAAGSGDDGNSTIDDCILLRCRGWAEPPRTEREANAPRRPTRAAAASPKEKPPESRLGRLGL